MSLNEQLTKAAKAGKTLVVEALLDRGADIHTVRGHEKANALILAASRGHTETVALLLERGAKVHDQGDKALLWSAETGRAETVGLLLKHGADIHAKGDHALRYCALNGHTETAQVILKHYPQKELKRALGLIDQDPIERDPPYPKVLILAELQSRRDRTEAQRVRITGQELEP